MKLVTLALAASLAATPALACIPLVTHGPNSTSIMISIGGNTATYFYDDLRAGSHALRAAQLQDLIQSLMDDRRLRESIQADDPDRFEDPDSPFVYWSDADGNPVKSIIDAEYVTSRCVIVDLVRWDGAEYSVTFTRVP